jgi:hypothetical protein
LIERIERQRKEENKFHLLLGLVCAVHRTARGD